MPKVIDVDERRTELARAASRLIARAGVGAATMRTVAAEAGWTTGALTHYFESKRELMAFTFQESLRARRAIAEASVPVGDPIEDLHAVLARTLPVDDGQREHWIVTIALCAEAAGDDELAALQRDAYVQHRDRIAARIADADLARGKAATLLAERLIAATNGIATQALWDPQGWPPKRQLDQLRASITALLPPP